jgi:DNA-binding PucR family transcriptional regulator
VRKTLAAIEVRVARDMPRAKLFWGVSAPCNTASRLNAAHGEAASAMLVVRKIGLGGNLAIHEELGIVELLTKMRSDVELAKFVSDSLGSVMSHDAKRHGDVIRTVRAYFECNCNQLTTARKLHVHEKTIKYRLERFEALTGFDLGSHEDRVRAHLAIAMYALSPKSDGMATV